MSKFSQALEKHIYKSGLTENQLAKISGFTRSYIALMKNGQRVSPDTQKMKKLLEALSLSPYEYDEVWKAYLKARYGDQTYELHSSIVSFIEGFGRIPKISIKSTLRHEIPNVRTIDNRIDLEYMVKAVVEQEALNKCGFIQIIMQQDFSFLFNLLPSVCRSNPNLKVDHIICLEGKDPQNTDELSYNLKVLERLLPVVISSPENGYEVYYYYDRMSSHFSHSTLMPYLVMTSEYIISISGNMEYAVVATDPDIHRLFNVLFRERKKMCRKLMSKISAGSNYFEYCMKHHPDSEKIYTIGSQPCFGVFPVDAMVKKYMAGKNEKLLGMFLTLLKQNRESYSSAAGVVSYFTKSGVEKLMEKGLVEELPGELYTSIERKDRKALLEMLITAVKNGSYEAYLLDEQKFSYPPELIMTAYSFTVVNILYMSQNQENRFALEEQSLTRMIYSFLEELQIGTYVYEKNETLAWLESVYEAFEV